MSAWAVVRAIARPPQFEHSEDLTRDVTAVKVAIKHLSPDHRAWLMAWLLYYPDDGPCSRLSLAGAAAVLRSMVQSFGSLAYASAPKYLKQLLRSAEALAEIPACGFDLAGSRSAR